MFAYCFVLYIFTGELCDGASVGNEFRVSIYSDAWKYRGILIDIRCCSGDIPLTGREHSAPIQAHKVLHDIG
jgi:hypothetical protein